MKFTDALSESAAVPRPSAIICRVVSRGRVTSPRAATMEALMAGASRRSLAERLEAWSGVCDAAAAGELADADASAALVSVVFASLREHDDKPSRVALARAVDAALTHSPAFLKAFAARLLKAASDKPQEMEPARRREFLRWSCALVRHLDLATQAGAFAKVAKAQGDLLCAEAVAASRKSHSAVTNESETARHEPTARANKSFQRLLGAFSLGTSALTSAEAYVDLVSPLASDGTPDAAKALVATAPAAATACVCDAKSASCCCCDICAKASCCCADMRWNASCCCWDISAIMRCASAACA